MAHQYTPSNYVTSLAGRLDLCAVPCPIDSPIISLGRVVKEPSNEIYLVPGEKSLGFTPDILARAGFKDLGEVISRLTDDSFHSNSLREYIKKADPRVINGPIYCHVFRHENEQGHEVLSVCFGHPETIDNLRVWGYRHGGRQLPWK